MLNPIGDRTNIVILVPCGMRPGSSSVGLNTDTGRRFEVITELNQPNVTEPPTQQEQGLAWSEE